MLRVALLGQRANKMSDGPTIIFPRKLLKKFIQMYKENTCLWDRDCIGYKIKIKRHEAVTKLTELVQEYDPSATRVHILRKIESLRACVRREYKKVVESRRTATSEDEVYTPHLWYYDLFGFILPEDDVSLKPKGSDSPEKNADATSLADSDDDERDIVEDDEQPFDSSMDNYTEMYNVSGNTVDVPENTSKRYTYDEDMNKSKRHCTEIEDEYDAIGINVAAKLRYLPSNMRILAEKLINDVLFQAQTNSLTTSTAIVTPDPFK